jgi:predicted AAA+ superfamily ATPase
MVNITDTAKRILLFLLKNPTDKYNPLQISKEFKITHAGAFKLLAGLYKKEFLVREKIGRYNLYGLNFKKKALRKYLSFLIQQEKDAQSAKVKVWLDTICRKINQASIALLFGSILHKEKPNDVDAVFVTPKNTTKFYQEVDKANAISQIKLHPIVQTKEDLINNIRKKDPVIMKSLGGILVFGDEEYFDVLAEVCYARE